MMILKILIFLGKKLYESVDQAWKELENFKKDIQKKGEETLDYIEKKSYKRNCISWKTLSY